MTKFNDIIAASEFADKYADSSYAPYGELNEESARLILRVATIEGCLPALLAHAWMNESSYRFYPPPNTNNSKNSIDWDFGPCQINYGVYAKNVEVNWIRPVAYNQEIFGSPNPDLFDGNPLMNVRIAARYLARIRGDWQGEGFTSLEAMKAGKFTGGVRVQHRAANWVKWEPYLTELFAKLTETSV